jgi:hypothetical protein
VAVGGSPARSARTAAAIGVLLLVGLLVLVIGSGPVDPLAGRARTDPDQAPRASVPGPTAFPSATPSATDASGLAISRRFGMVAHLLWRGEPAAAIADLDMIRGVGLGLVRFDVSWRHVEPAPGDYRDLDDLDEVMAAIAARGMRPVVTVIETPDWANGGRGPWVPPDDPGTYARFAAALAARYATVVDVAWEIWNEPNDPHFWQPAPDPAAYAALLAATSHAIHTADPGATVLGGSILYGDTGFLEAMYAAGARGTFDGLAIHPYAENRAPWDTGDPYHSFLGTIDNLRGVMTAHGDGAKGLWLTEVGWAIQPGVDVATRADYLAQAVSTVAPRAEIEAMAVYVLDAVDNPGFGVVRDGVGDESFTAYAAAVRALRDRPAP